MYELFSYLSIQTRQIQKKLINPFSILLDDFVFSANPTDAIYGMPLFNSFFFFFLFTSFSVLFLCRLPLLSLSLSLFYFIFGLLYCCGRSINHNNIQDNIICRVLIDSNKCSNTSAATQPRSHAATQPRSHAATQPRSHAATQPRSHAAMQPCSHASTLQSTARRPTNSPIHLPTCSPTHQPPTTNLATLSINS